MYLVKHEFKHTHVKPDDLRMIRGLRYGTYTIAHLRTETNFSFEPQEIKFVIYVYIGYI
jgi:hypothetical protein